MTTIVIIATATLTLLPWTKMASAAGLPFLQIGSSARANALGDAAAALIDIDAMGANPAAVGFEEGSIGLTHSSWIQNTRHNYATAVRPMRSGLASLQLSMSHADKLEHRVGPSDEPVGEFGVYEWALGLGYSWQIPGGVRLGAAGKLIRQSIYTESAIGGAIDIGVILPFREHLHAAAAVRNVGIVNDLDEDPTDLPQQVRIALAYAAESTSGERLSFLETQITRGAGVSVHAGIEWPVSPMLSLRTGYQTTDSRTLSAGFGLHLWSLRVDYGYLPFAVDLGQTHRVSLYLWPLRSANAAPSS